MRVRFELYIFLLNGTNTNSIKYNRPCLNSYKEYFAVREGGKLDLESVRQYADTDKHTAHPPALRFLVPPLSPSQQICAVSLAPGAENILSACPPGQQQSPTTRCSRFMCSGMHMDAQV